MVLDFFADILIFSLFNGFVCRYFSSLWRNPAENCASTFDYAEKIKDLYKNTGCDQGRLELTNFAFKISKEIGTHWFKDLQKLKKYYSELRRKRVILSFIACWNLYNCVSSSKGLSIEIISNRRDFRNHLWCKWCVSCDIKSGLKCGCWNKGKWIKTAAQPATSNFWRGKS